VNNTARTPIDTDRLAKGDTVSVSEIERITSTVRGTDGYALAAMALCQFIQKAKGNAVTVRVDGGSIRLLTDEEAVDYNERQFASSIGRAGRAHYRQMGVDTSNLASESRAAHERSVLVNGKVLMAAINAKKDALRVLSHPRATPLMQPR
jgi:hypothetical protein